LAPDLGYAYLLAGRLAEGLAILEDAVLEESRTQVMRYQSLLLIHLSEGYLWSSRTTEAAARALDALALSRQREERGCETAALRLLGEIAAHADPPEVEQAESYYRQALALAEALGMRPLVAHCHLGLGALYQRDGRLEPALTELTAAAELYRAMEMTFWLEKAEAALGQVAG
jgi:tetratricopeptide (TPR) repeat protein